MIDGFQRLGGCVAEDIEHQGGAFRPCIAGRIALAGGTILLQPLLADSQKCACGILRARLRNGGDRLVDLDKRRRQVGQLMHDLEHGETVAEREKFLKLVVPAAQRLLRSEEHTSELQSLMRISYAVSCLKKKKVKTADN